MRPRPSPSRHEAPSEPLRPLPALLALIGAGQVLFWSAWWLGYRWLPEGALQGKALAANLQAADLQGADLRDANLSGASLNAANLRNTTGLLSPIDYMLRTYERTADGYIVYAGAEHVDGSYPHRSLEASSVIEEVANRNPTKTTTFVSGIVVGTMEWAKRDAINSADVWRCLLRWEWLPGVVVPCHTDGRLRTENVQLLGRV